MKSNRAILKLSLRDAFQKWLELTKVFSKLTTQEIAVVSEFLYQRYFLSQHIDSEELINKLLFSKDTKKVIRESLDIKPQIFLNILSNLRSKKVFSKDSINKAFIPIIDNNIMNIIFELRIESDGNKG